MLPYLEIEKKLDYTFQDKTFLEEAFTHSSFAGRYNARSNERMEYLGDAVLQLAVTEWQFKKDGNASEGKLTKNRQKLVCRDALDTAVDALGIMPYLKVAGKAQENVGGKAKSSLFEAVIAAIYLDGGYEQAKNFILRHGNLILDFTENNPIGELKEYLEKRRENMPKKEWEKLGADNSPTFKCTLTILGESAKGEGKTKHEAEATAAQRLLFELKKKNK